MIKVSDMWQAVSEALPKLSDYETSPGVRRERAIADTFDALGTRIFEMIALGAPPPKELAELLVAQLKARGRES